MVIESMRKVNEKLTNPKVRASLANAVHHFSNAIYEKSAPELNEAKMEKFCKLTLSCFQKEKEVSNIYLYMLSLGNILIAQKNLCQIAKLEFAQFKGDIAKIIGENPELNIIFKELCSLL